MLGWVGIWEEMERRVSARCERAVRGSNRLNGPLPSFLSTCGRQAAIPCMIVCMATPNGFVQKPLFSIYRFGNPFGLSMA
jgi:hypothetical protein